jgi:uncharacterized protein YigE (DUF2233 family)
MKSKSIIFTILVVLVASVFFQFAKDKEDDFVVYQVDIKKKNLDFYWKDDKQNHFGSIQNLKLWLNANKKKLEFAMNGGMYKKDRTPQGLFIQDYSTKSKIDTTNGNGNFYLKPNGVFYITNKNVATICTTSNFKDNGQIKMATQSGPMLLINGEIHKAFTENSANVNIRNGVGILPNNELLFAMSKKEVNLYDFATFFKNKGCKNALYLDGFVSRVYCPKEKWTQTDGDFGVIIAVTKENK